MGICGVCHHTHDEWQGNCPHCCGMGRVGNHLRVGDPEFGKPIMCPACRGSRNLGRVVAEDDEASFFRRARIPADMRRYRLSTWPNQADSTLAVAREFVTGEWPPERYLLTFQGEPGRGKTGMATSMLHELWRRHGWTGQFWPVIDLLDRYKATFGDGATETTTTVDNVMAKTPLLVLDDYGAQKGTEWAYERLFRVIDERYRERRATVITTNAPLAALGERIYDRIAHTGSAQVLHFGGESKRRRGAA